MPEDKLLHSLKEFVRRRRLIKPGDKLILAVSGGIDSIALLDLFHHLQEPFNLELVISHVNHQLRGVESELDEQFVRTRANEYGVDVYVECVNVKEIAESLHRSIQETARDLRYKFFHELRNSIGFTAIATAHHADDNAETILFNFFRGSGVHGLSGIPVQRKDDNIIRPLLFASRNNIAEYVKNRNLAFREDSSNTKTVYTRNFIRLELLPLIRENINPNINATINRASELFQSLEEYLRNEIEKALPAIIAFKTEMTVELDREKLLSFPSFLREYLVKRAVEEFTLQDLDFSTVKTLFTIISSETGASHMLAPDIVFYRNRSNLIVKRIPPKTEFNYGVVPNKEYQFEEFRLTLEEVPEAEMIGNPLIEYIDADRLGNTLTIRSWHNGDSFIPLGMSQKKKLSDFFIDMKIPLFEKERVAILVSDSEIVWVCGYRLDNRYKITSSTKRFLKLEYQPRL